MTNIGLTPTQLKGSASLLQTLLADEYILLVKTKKYHWNVTDKNFRDLHLFLDEQYEQINEMVDEIAERIRQLGQLVAATLDEFTQLARLKEPKKNGIKTQEMLKNLLDDHEATIRNLRKDLETCEEKYNDMGTNDFLTGLMQKHEKMAWMLRSFLS